MRRSAIWLCVVGIHCEAMNKPKNRHYFYKSWDFLEYSHILGTMQIRLPSLFCMGSIAEWRNHLMSKSGSWNNQESRTECNSEDSASPDFLTWFASRQGAHGLLLFLSPALSPCPSGLWPSGGVLRGQEGHRGLRPCAPAQGLPEDSDQVDQLD